MINAYLASPIVLLSDWLERFRLKIIRQQYMLRLQSQYFCKKKQQIYVVLQVRGKRTAYIQSVRKIISDRELLKEMHPVEACLIGLIANNERNGIIDNSQDCLNRAKRFMYRCSQQKHQPMLTISGKYFSEEKNAEITVLKSPCIRKELHIPTLELADNAALLYALDPSQAIAIGYSASEEKARLTAKEPITA